MIYYSACLKDCYDTCSIITKVENGNILINGNKNNPITDGFLCLKSKWYVEASHTKYRITKPYLNKNGKFYDISWREAFNIIAERIKDYDRFLPYDYAGNRGLISYNFPQRLFNYYGTLKLKHSLCDEAGNNMLKNLLGTSTGYDPEKLDDVDVYIYWGMNPAWTNIHGYVKVKKSNAKIIVIDPTITETAKSANLHIRIFPGHDFKFALFVAKLLNDKLKKYPDIDISFKELDDNEINYGIKLSNILLNSKNPVIHMGYGFQRQLNGALSVMAIAYILSILDKEYNFIYDRKHKIDYEYLRGKNENRKEINQYTISEETDKFDTIFIYGSNPFNSLSNQKKFRERIKEKGIYVITHELYYNDTVMNSDLILPAAHFFEFNDLVDSYFHDYIMLNQKIFNPPEQALSNHDLFVNLAKFLGINDKFLLEDEMSIIENIIKRSNLDKEYLFKNGFCKIEPDIFRGKFNYQYFIENLNNYIDEKNNGFRLLSPTHLNLIGSLHNNIYEIDNFIYINDQDAKELNIKDNDDVRVYNDKYSVITKAKISDKILKGTVLIYRGHWIKNYGWNVNFLTDDKAQLFEGPSQQSSYVYIEKL